jgi:hypothetical protein
MKRLNINPVKHDIEVMESDFEPGLSTVSIKLGDEQIDHCFTEKEARRFGEWFIQLSKHIKNKTAKLKKAEEKGS